MLPKPNGNPANYAPLPSERGRGRGCNGFVFQAVTGAFQAVTGAFQAVTGALVGIERCRFRWEMAS